MLFINTYLPGRRTRNRKRFYLYNSFVRYENNHQQSANRVQFYLRTEHVFHSLSRLLSLTKNGFEARHRHNFITNYVQLFEHAESLPFFSKHTYIRTVLSQLQVQQRSYTICLCTRMYEGIEVEFIWC